MQKILCGNYNRSAKKITATLRQRRVSRPNDVLSPTILCSNYRRPLSR